MQNFHSFNPLSSHLCLWIEDDILDGVHVADLPDVVHPVSDVDALGVRLGDELRGVADRLPEDSPEELAPVFCLQLSRSSLPLLQYPSHNVRHG